MTPDVINDRQRDAVSRMRNGCILNGGTGSGKSRTSLYYYFKEQGGSYIGSKYVKMKNPKDLYIITTALKRDKKEWEAEMCLFRLCKDPKANLYKNKIVVDSWNNIMKYKDVKNAFFIFDEDRVTGSGAWVKAFLKIAKVNDWIILSATPGDRWEDYRAVFIANGFYRNKTEFASEHLIYDHRVKFPKICGYRNTGRLIRLRDRILIDMPVERHTTQIHEDRYAKYDVDKYRVAMKTRTNPYETMYIDCKPDDPDALLLGVDISIQEVAPNLTDWEYDPNDKQYIKQVNKPIEQASSLCYVLRHIVNESEDRQRVLLEFMDDHPKVIIFYNFDYERDILLNLVYPEGTEIAEWNGHNHQPIPDSRKWVYLVQYTAGCEGWNCISTDTIIFYSQNYSYKVTTQACGRIDRLNTPYYNLYYYHLKSRSGIDLAISKALAQKKEFNENRWVSSR